MRLEFDRERCTGHGRCWTLAGEFFKADDAGYCIDPSGHVPAEFVAAARIGEQNCPEGAILLVGDDD